MVAVNCLPPIEVCMMMGLSFLLNRERKSFADTKAAVRLLQWRSNGSNHVGWPILHRIEQTSLSTVSFLITSFQSQRQCCSLWSIQNPPSNLAQCLRCGHLNWTFRSKGHFSSRFQSLRNAKARASGRWGGDITSSRKNGCCHVSLILLYIFAWRCKETRKTESIHDPNVRPQGS